MHNTSVICWEFAVGILQREILLNIFAGQRLKSNFRASAAAQQLRPNPQKWVILDSQFRQPVAEDHEDTSRCDTCRKESEQVGRTDVCPMEIINHDDQGMNRGDLDTV